MNIVEQIRERVEPRAKATILVVVTGDTPMNFVESAIELARLEDARILLVSLVSAKEEVPEEFYDFAKLEGLEGDPKTWYLTMLGEQTLRPFEKVLRERGVEFESIVEIGELSEILPTLTNVYRPTKVVLRAKDMVRPARWPFRRKIERLDSVNVPVTIVP
ncbi:MAG: hypothetical protein NZ920_02430 [Aigarchaeota archaeon]|nr:hypothetical protein [Aigarchaeota archaeon]MDW8092518.1 hypothetical protein [Nitrososphaerota archaeon]